MTKKRRFKFEGRAEGHYDIEPTDDVIKATMKVLQDHIDLLAPIGGIGISIIFLPNTAKVEKE